MCKTGGTVLTKKVGKMGDGMMGTPNQEPAHTQVDIVLNKNSRVNMSLLHFKLAF